MHDFLLKEITNTDLETELKTIGFDKGYISKAVKKFEYKNLKIFKLTPAQANIIKQTALSVGADCATHREVITGKAEVSDCIIGGSFSQLEKIAQKLTGQPFGLRNLAELISKNLNTETKTRTQIMGILNITPDSFSDGGEYLKTSDATEHLLKLISDGADIIDIGAESTRPYSKAVDSQTQIERIIPVLEYIEKNDIQTPISIDTRSSVVAKQCLKYKSVKFINDVSGLQYDNQMAKLLSKYPQVKVIIQHSQGTPEDMQNNPQYKNLTDDIYLKLKERTDFAVSNGISADRIIIDTGIGFGKTREQNLELIKRWQDFKTLGFPVLLGISRKSFLGTELKTNEEKDIQTLAFNSTLMLEGIDYIRVHNVKIHKIFQTISN